MPRLLAMLPTAIFFIMIPLSNYLAKHDNYRTDSVQGFRSTKAVKSPDNWRKSQLLERDSSFFFGMIQLFATLAIYHFFPISEGTFLLIITGLLFLLIGIQFLYINSKLD